MGEDEAPDGAQQRECSRQNNLAYVGLMVIGVYMVQPFLTATSLDVSAKICVVACAVAIPLLAALLMVTWQEGFRRRLTTSVVVNVAKAVAQTSAFVGVVAGFWRVYWIAGAVVLATAVVAVGVHSAGYVHLEPAIGEDATAAAVDEVIVAHPEEWARIVEGDDKRRGKLTGFFVGRVMKATLGQADWKAVTALLRQRAGPDQQRQ
jgi:hypothetical protein